jgi:hypothetical protein
VRRVSKLAKGAAGLHINSVSYITACPYISKADMKNMFHVSSSTATRRVSELDAYVKKGRYGPYAILDGTGVTWINLLVLIDYLKYKKDLDEGKHVPPYDPYQTAKAIAWGELSQDMM